MLKKLCGRDGWHIEGSRNMNCMDCKKEIFELRRAPSGTMIPRCEECNDRRWKQHYESESEQLAKTSPGINTPFDEYYSRYEDEE